MSKFNIAITTFLSVVCTVYAPLELTRYIVIWQRLGATYQWLTVTRLEIAGIWSLWFLWHIFLVFLLSRVKHWHDER